MKFIYSLVVVVAWSISFARWNSRTPHHSMYEMLALPSSSQRSSSVSVCSVHRFSVGVLPGTKLESGPATLHLCNNLLALARDVPPVIIGHWNLPDLRRYGPVPNGFVFEGGTRCGYCKFDVTFMQRVFSLDKQLYVLEIICHWAESAGALKEL